MDKKSKQRRHKSLTEDELSEVAPRGASFDTEEGRAAQGMRPDIGSGGGDTVEIEGATGAADGESGTAETTTSEKGDATLKGDAEEGREKLLPEAKSRPRKPQT